MSGQSLRSRMAERVMPLLAKRVFPSEWLEAGDDRVRLGAIAKQRRRLDGPRPDLVLERNWGRSTTKVEGHDLHLLTPKGGSTGRVLFYCHGGAFVIGPSAAEWVFAAQVAGALTHDLALYEYPKVPEVDSEAIRSTTMAAFEMIADRYAANKMVIAGTSAGGGLAVSTLVQRHRTGLELPRAAALFSPWLDMTVSHPDAALMESRDRLLPLPQLRRDGELYVGDGYPMDPLISPRFTPTSELAAMPPTVVTAGEHELLLPEDRELVDGLKSAGVDARLVLEAHGQHVGVMAPSPEGRAALDEFIGHMHAILRR